MKIIISAVAKGVQEAARQTGSAIKSGFSTGKEAVKAFNDTVGNGQKTLSGLTSGIKSMLAGVAGFAAIRNATQIMQDADNAAFNMQTSISAANREFKNAGSVQEWEDTVRSLSNELKIYSDTALRGAISRTIDMTKRLGLSKDQMVEVIKRSADLGAGKVDLEGAIERVTAALRGEAESAEFLGLTLNENYVKAQYEANKANKTAWESLTDLEKAQARYNAFLQQSEQFTGRAAASSKTFAGSLQEIKKEIVNSTSNSKEFEAALQDVAAILKSNSGEIGAIVAQLVTFAAKTIEMAIEWKGLLLTLLGTTAAIMAVTKLLTVINGLNAAFKVLTGSSIISWIGNLSTAIGAVAAQAGIAGAAMKLGLAAAAAWGTIKIIEAIKAFYDWRVEAKKVAAGQAELAKSTEQQMQKWEEFKNFKLPGDLTKAAQEDLENFRMSLIKARGYYMAMKIQLEQKSGETTIFGTATKEAIDAQKKLKTVNDRLREIQADFKRLGGSATEAAVEMIKPAAAVKATTEQLKAFEAAAKTAYEAAKKSAADYAQKMIEWEEKIKYAKLSTEDKIRELGQKGMTAAEVWADTKLQADEKYYAAKEALAKGDYALAEKLAKDAEGLFAELATEVKNTKDGKDVVTQSLNDTKEVAVNGITAVGAFIQELYTKQKEAAAAAQAEWTATADGIKKQLDEIAKQREANVAITLSGVEAAEDTIASLIKPAYKTIYIRTVKSGSSSSSSSSSSGEDSGLAGGGGLPGYGGGDRRSALLEDGEWVIRKEAVKKYGSALFAGLNSMRLDLPGLVRARIGGMISNISMPAITVPRFAYQTGGPVAGGGSETMTLRLQVGGAEMPLTVIGNNKVTRGMVKEFEKELIKMGLSRR